MLEFKDGGESHFSPAMTGIMSGIPAMLVLDKELIVRDLLRRQWGFGRGARSLLDKDTEDKVHITSGVMYKKEFSICPGYRADLDKGEIPESLRQKFKEKCLLLPEKTVVMVEGANWVIADGNEGKKKVYLVGLGKGREDKDRLNIYSAHQFVSLGTPISLEIENPGGKERGEYEIPPRIPRPGHVDFAASLKYGYANTSYGAERASARQTAVCVAFGAMAKQFIREVCGIEVLSFVSRIGEEEMDPNMEPFVNITSDKAADILKELRCLEKEIYPYLDKPCKHIKENEELTSALCMHTEPCEHSSKCMRDASIRAQVRCPDGTASGRMFKLIQELYDENSGHYDDTLGGEFVVVALNVPIGLGSHVSWDSRIDGILAQAIMSIPAVKAVRFGDDFSAQPYGSSVHDQIWFSKQRGVYRETNHAGGIEGGITNGEPIVIRASVKPPPTLGKKKALDSVNLDLLIKSVRPDLTVEEVSEDDVNQQADVVRSDRCVVHGAGVVAEAAVALTLAGCILEKWGSDNVEAIKCSYEKYDDRIRAILRK